MITKTQWAMELAIQIAKIATCPRRSVGCVLLDSDYKILSTGFNGVPPGLKHCTDYPCAGTAHKDKCMAIHAEINALIQCPDVSKIRKAFVTCFPCFRCAKALMNTGVKEVIYIDVYNGFEETAEMLTSSGISIHKYEVI